MAGLTPKNKKFKVGLLMLLMGLFFCFSGFSAQDSPSVCAVYLTGIGCGNCAQSDPGILFKMPAEFPNLLVIEYEIFKLASQNKEVSVDYFDNYLPSNPPGVPFFILNKKHNALGVEQIASAGEFISKQETNACPLPGGDSKDFKQLDLELLPGKIKIWHKDRVLILGKETARPNRFKSLLFSSDIDSVLSKFDARKTAPEDVLISGGKITFEHAASGRGWLFQWGKKTITQSKNQASLTGSLPAAGIKAVIDSINSLQRQVRIRNLWISLEAFIIILLILLLFRKQTSRFFSKSRLPGIFFRVLVPFVGLALIFILAGNISGDFLKNLGHKVPLPAFTFFIGLVDGFNPCNLFVLTLLLALLVSASGSRKKVYAVGFIFVFVVFIFYFIFMAAWLNIFKYLGFFTPLRVVIGSVAVLAGLINCKDFFFFKKGVSLTIGDKQKGLLIKKMNQVRKVAEKGSFLMLALSSFGLAVFSSFIELPCTAGFPIIFTSIISARVAAESGSYYLWIVFYNLVYILPLLLIVVIFGYNFRTERISCKQIRVIKLIGGIIMVILGLVLLANPQFIGVGLK